MAIINRFFIRRYKEILIDVPPGLFQGPGFSTFNLDSPNPNPNGTSDFLGLIKQSVLIGEIYKDTADTNPKRLRQDPIPIGRYQQLTDDDYLELIQAGDIILNPQNGGKSQIIGWVELGKSYPSFYYQPCTNGKQPRVDNYFDFADMALSLYKVLGEGTGLRALEQIGNWNINETYDNWGALPPSNPPLLFQDYIQLSIGGGGVYDYPVTNHQRLNSIPLLMADREENFNRNNTIILSPSFSDPLSLTPTIEKTVFGKSRITILNGFRPFTDEQKTVIGKCLDKPGVVGPGGPVGPDPDPGRPDTGGDGDEEQEDTVPAGCFNYQINFAPYEIISGYETETMNSFDFPIDFDKEDTIRLLRYSYQRQEFLFGYRDPRELFAENAITPNGIVHVRLNHKTCTADIYPALRDKDGDIPEPIGPAVSNHFKNVRKRLNDMYRLNKNPLIDMGMGEDGYVYYSDGNSYQELLGETVIGCGDPISFGIDIPEIRVDIIQNMENKFYRPFGGYATPYFTTREEVVGNDIDNQNTVSYGYYLTQTATKKINLHIMDLLYGIPSGDVWYNYPRNFIDTPWTGSVGGKRYPQKVMTPIWQNVMYPIYDKLMGYVPTNSKILQQAKFGNNNYKTTEKQHYSIIDDAISIETKDFLDSDFTGKKPFRPNQNWDWLLNKGLGAFTLNFTYKAGPNGILDTAGSQTSFSVDIDYIRLAQFAIGVIGYIVSLFGPKETGIPFRKSTLEIDPDTYSGTEEEDRMLQTPRRLHKKGCTILQSKTGLYSTSNLPCPIIFLGYHDDYYAKTSPASIEKYEKNEIIEPMTIAKLKMSYTVGKPDISEIHTVPSIKPRIKKYGRNPLLDIFYLNVVNPYIENLDYNNVPPRTGNRYSQERKWSNPNRLPFRSNRSEKNWHLWPELTYGEFPSIFPSHWQYNDLYSFRPKDLSSKWDTITDNQWDKKVKTTILNSEDRWSLGIEYQSNDTNKPLVVLTDKTPILDLYFGLMEMHVKGVSWEEIFQYVETAHSCIKNNNYLKWTREEKTEIDLVKLEKLWEIVSTRLDEIDQYGVDNKNVYISSFDFGQVKIQTKDFNTGAGQDLENDRGEVFGNLLLKNNTTSSFIIESISLNELDYFDGESFDFYERKSSDYFELPQINNGINDKSYLTDYITSKKTPSILPITSIKNKILPAKNSLDYISIPIKFSSFGSQPGYQYVTNLSLRLKNESNNESVLLNSPIFANVVSERQINGKDDSNHRPLILPEEINFGIVLSPIDDSIVKNNWSISSQSDTILQGFPNLQQILFTNYSEYDSIKIEEAEIFDEKVFNSQGVLVKSGILENFVFLNKLQGVPLTNRPRRVSINKMRKINPNITILSSDSMINAKSNSLLIALTPKISDNLVYYCSVRISYSILPREDTLIRFGNKKITEEYIIKLVGITVKN